MLFEALNGQLIFNRDEELGVGACPDSRFPIELNLNLKAFPARIPQEPASSVRGLCRVAPICRWGQAQGVYYCCGCSDSRRSAARAVGSTCRNGQNYRNKSR